MKMYISIYTQNSKLLGRFVLQAVSFIEKLSNAVRLDVKKEM